VGTGFISAFPQVKAHLHLVPVGQARVVIELISFITDRQSSSSSPSSFFLSFFLS
jgi:hypothetical protein